MIPRRARHIAVVLLLGAVVLLCLPAGYALATSSAPSPPEGEEFIYAPIKNGRYLPFVSAPKTAEIVEVGIYALDVYDIDFQSNTCYISAYVWLTWKGDTDPAAELEFTNAVEEWGTMATPIYDAPKELPDDSKYQVIRVNGRFYQPYDLRRFPLDEQRIAMYLEDSERSYEEVVLVADRDNSGIDASMVIPGWNIQHFSSQTQIHDYTTTLGDTSDSSASLYSSLVYRITLAHNTNYFVWKLLFPLVVVLLTNWLALLLRPNWIDLRTAMPATALLTTVFLQESYSSGLPDVSYLVLMDKIYVVAYVMIITTLAIIIWSNHKLRESPYADVVERVRRADVVAAGTQFVAFWVILALLVFG